MKKYLLVILAGIMKKYLLVILAGLSFLSLVGCAELATVVKCSVRDSSNRPCQ